MKYQTGDILFDFEKKEIFVFNEKQEQKRNFFKVRLITPGEKIIFDRKFKNHLLVNFSDFKVEMPYFDGRQLRGLNYGNIAIDETIFLFFRSYQTKFNLHTIEDKLLELIMNYLHLIEHNKKEDQKEAEKARQFGRLLNDLKDCLKD